MYILQKKVFNGSITKGLCLHCFPNFPKDRKVVCSLMGLISYLRSFEINQKLFNAKEQNRNNEVRTAQFISFEKLPQFIKHKAANWPLFSIQVCTVQSHQSLRSIIDFFHSRRAHNNDSKGLREH